MRGRGVCSTLNADVLPGVVEGKKNTVNGGRRHDAAAADGCADVRKLEMKQSESRNEFSVVPAGAEGFRKAHGERLGSSTRPATQRARCTQPASQPAQSNLTQTNQPTNEPSQRASESPSQPPTPSARTQERPTEAVSLGDSNVPDQNFYSKTDE